MNGGKERNNRLQNVFLTVFLENLLRFERMNNIKKVLSAWMLVACVLPVAAQYPVIPDSVKARGAKQEAEFERKSDAAWEKALPTVLEEAKKGRPYKPWASKPEDLIKSNIPAFPGAGGVCGARPSPACN